MRLLTHNLIACNRRQCTGGFPLKIVVDEKSEDATTVEPSEFQPELVKQLLGKLDWEALVKTADQFGLQLPPTFTDSDKSDEHFLRAVHEAVVEFHVLEGKLVCPVCAREYPVSNGIPNMLLQDDEV
ncbi:Trm112p family domain-containing protein [Toxoplasma gondii VEG]|uniref:TRM112-like protein n=3 Tax=Toxoplasma gondii TaxID=5811 RepID=B9Q608_TOXGV|nr:Trm112p family domain-containing protein [Toxoplasma gondii VEG]KFG52155.1 Trm112p family domain-containing protein [Toxoplasma gondii p89]PUA92093.1 Trm112p family domain-containing protein [Toxoplasma gondii TgCATBr9]CEL75320.1 TPA: TRM112-like protein [Toxoplasma gondii VEG]